MLPASCSLPSPTELVWKRNEACSDQNSPLQLPPEQANPQDAHPLYGGESPSAAGLICDCPALAVIQGVNSILGICSRKPIIALKSHILQPRNLSPSVCFLSLFLSWFQIWETSIIY